MKLLIGVATVMLWAGAVAHAHPHIFVNTQAGFQIDAGNRLQALRILWRYDAFTTLFLFDALDLDRDSDGQLNDTDKAAIVAGETDWPPGYNGDIYLSVAGEAWPLGRPQNAVADMIDSEITVSFDLPLLDPVDVSRHQVSLQIYDPVYYYDYSVTVDSASQRLAGPCQATAIPFEPDKADIEILQVLSELSREETPTEQNIGARFADEIVLVCR